MRLVLSAAACSHEDAWLAYADPDGKEGGPEDVYVSIVAHLQVRTNERKGQSSCDVGGDDGVSLLFSLSFTFLPVPLLAQVSNPSFLTLPHPPQGIISADLILSRLEALKEQKSDLNKMLRNAFIRLFTALFLNVTIVHPSVKRNEKLLQLIDSTVGSDFRSTVNQ